MMMPGMEYKQGDIVVIPFPFTDLTAIKLRPVLIISHQDYNNAADDVVVCGITSNLKDSLYSVLVDNAQLREGHIPLTSRIKADKLFTLKQSLIRKKVAVVQEQVLENVKQEIRAVFHL